MKELIIFGRSPFINELDLSKIDYNRYDVCCINYPIPNIRVHYVVSADKWVEPVLAPKTEWISENTGWKFKKGEKIITQEGYLSWRYYSSSLAVNFGVLRGYKTIYLAGVDLVEDNKPFNHYDGIVNKRNVDASSCVAEKEYIKQIAKDINIFQVNPGADWLEYKDIGL